MLRPAGAVGAGADAFAVPRGMAQVAGEYLAQATFVDDLHYNGVSILAAGVAGDSWSVESRNPNIPAGACPAVAHTMRSPADCGGVFRTFSPR
jgi:hypothetical protein